MQSIHFPKEQLSHLYSISGLLAWDEVNHLGKTVNHHKNRVISPLCSRQPQHEIHANINPWLFWNGQRHI
ncbi:hypothetical protein Syun_025711 [Stephania yunnanensis]|uniref:Uncharacterized protein n=1 Tax=Stephania yunnanensis TaxID=152371 RepID=A0AAP0ESX7_9MAGN